MGSSAFAFTPAIKRLGITQLSLTPPQLHARPPHWDYYTASRVLNLISEYSTPNCLLSCLAKPRTPRSVTTSLLPSMPAEDKMVSPWPIISSPPPAWFAALVAVGFYTVVRYAATFLLWLHRAFLRPGRDLAARYGTWAVVTGATDGIGRAVALELARAGLHLVLVGRSPGKLARVEKEVLAAAPPSCKVRTVAFDLAVTGDDARRGVARVAAAVEGRDVGVLVNNAGATYPCAAYFHEVERPVWEAVVRVNVDAATRITRALLPMMAARGRGAVVNVGSGSSVVVPAFPLYAVYAASKAYVDQFSRSLSVEYKQYGVDVQCQIPLYVATKMSPVKGASPFIPSPEEYARAAVRCIGYEARCVPYWRHSVQWFLASLMPDAALNHWRLQTGIRKRNQMRALLGEEACS